LAFVSSGPFLLAFVSSVLFFWPLHHLSFSFGQKGQKKSTEETKGKKKRTDETKAKRKGQDDAKGKIKGQMIQRPKEKHR
jgi:hypothetical protein